MARELMVLASSSARRRAFFEALGLKFRIVPPDVDEQPGERERPEHYARRLAEDKARAVLPRCPPQALIVAADTIVVRGREILQKPVDDRDAERMLRKLSGQWHAVISGWCVARCRRGRIVKLRSGFVRTAVLFKRLTREEIRAYVATGEPRDKAGAYAIQGIGAFMVRAIRGSYTNVVGLPLAEVVDVMERDFGVVVRPGQSKRVS